MARDMVHVRRPRSNQFAEEPAVRIGRSQFNRSHGLKITFDASILYPILVDEILPGDTFTCRLNGFARIFSPLDAPVMDNIEIETFFFFVPTRLVWDNWQYFNGEHDAKGAQDTSYTIPVLASGWTASHDQSGTGANNLLGMFGLPHSMTTANHDDINALPLRCYNLIYNEWFRDQNLIDEETVNTDNGPDGTGDYGLLKSAKKHDYFTSCLPYLQKGTAPTISMGGSADVLGIGVTTQTVDTSVSDTIYESDGGSSVYVDQWLSSSGNISISGDAPTGAYPQIYADLSSATGISINDLRESVAIQRLLERDARGGTRYVELIKSHFGVTSPDYRLQRPEFLGGGKSFINISPVANTVDQDATISASGNNVFQGELRGVGTGIVSGHGWAKSFTEHGYVIGIMRARGDLTYFQGVDRMWSRSDRYDFYIPALAHLGEQSVLNKEIYNSETPATDDAVFGYQERWMEYRTKHSRIIGKLNPDASTPISHWHLAEDFGSLPALNQTFIEDATPMSRVTTIDTQPDFLADLWFDYRCARPIPVHSIPSLIGRF